MTLEQSKVTAVLEQLKLEHQPSGVMGGPMAFKVTDATLEYLKGKTFEVGSGGEITLK